MNIYINTNSIQFPYGRPDGPFAIGRYGTSTNKALNFFRFIKDWGGYQLLSRVDGPAKIYKYNTNDLYRSWQFSSGGYTNSSWLEEIIAMGLDPNDLSDEEVLMICMHLGK